MATEMHDLWAENEFNLQRRAIPSRSFGMAGNTRAAAQVAAANARKEKARWSSLAEVSARQDSGPTIRQIIQ